MSTIPASDKTFTSSNHPEHSTVTTASFQEKIDALAIVAQTLTGADGIAIALRDGKDIVCRASTGCAPEAGIVVEPGQGVCGTCISEIRIAVAQDRPGEIKSVVAVPILVDGGVEGMVAAFAAQPNAFSPSAIEQVCRVAKDIRKLVAEPKQAEPATTESVPLPHATSQPESKAEPEKPLLDLSPVLPQSDVHEVNVQSVWNKQDIIEIPTLPDLSEIPVTPAPQRSTVVEFPRLSTLKTPPEPVEPPKPLAQVIAPPPVVAAPIAKVPMPEPATAPGLSIPLEKNFELPELAAPSEPDPLLESFAAEVMKPAMKPETLAMHTLPAPLPVAKPQVHLHEPKLEPLKIAAEPLQVSEPVKPVAHEFSFGGFSGVAETEAEPEHPKKSHFLGWAAVAALVIVIAGLAGFALHLRSVTASATYSPAAKPAPEPPQPVVDSPAVTTAPAATTTSVPAPAAAEVKPTSQPAAPAVVTKPESQNQAPKKIAQPMVVANSAAPVRKLDVAEVEPTLGVAAPNAVRSVPALGGNAAVPVLAAPSKPKVSETVPARLISKVDPTVPAIAKSMHILGTVALKVIVKSDGTIGVIHVEKGDPILANAAKDAVRKWRYQPAMLNGEKIDSEVQISVDFSRNR